MQRGHLHLNVDFIIKCMIRCINSRQISWLRSTSMSNLYLYGVNWDLRGDNISPLLSNLYLLHLLTKKELWLGEKNNWIHYLSKLKNIKCGEIRMCERERVLESQTPKVLLVNLTPYIHTIWMLGSLITVSIHLVINQRHRLTAPIH